MRDTKPMDECRCDERLKPKGEEYTCFAYTRKSLIYSISSIVYLQLNKKDESRGYKNITLRTIINTITDKTVNKITHHVPPRQMIYTKKQIG